MEKSDLSSTSTSGVVASSFESISNEFVSHTEMRSVGFNRLYKAQRYGKWFVLKGLSPEFVDDLVYKELLAKEFELGTQLDHPNIARTIGFEYDELVGYCIVIEFVDGCSLRDYIKTKPSLSERRKVVVELLEAMVYYHEKQIIHRDLKPDNIMITRNGHNVKIIDFGLADSDYHEILKQPAGTNKYAAPEQMIGTMPIDCRADIFAFGLILKQIFPHRYSSIVRKCTRLNRNDRYHNAKDVLRHFNRFNIFPPILLSVILVVPLLVFALTPRMRGNGLDGQNIQVKTDTVIVVKKVTTLLDDSVVGEMTCKIDSLFQPFWKMYESSSNKGKVYWKCIALLPTDAGIMTDNGCMTSKKLIIGFLKERYPQCADMDEDLNELYERLFLLRTTRCTDSLKEVVAKYDVKSYFSVQ